MPSGFCLYKYNANALKVDATASLYCGKIFCVKEENIRISASMGGDDYNGVNMDVERNTELLAEDDRWISDMDFCRKTGFSYSTLNGWKNGRRNPSSELIGVLCNCIGISRNKFYSEGVYAKNNEKDRDTGQDAGSYKRSMESYAYYSYMIVKLGMVDEILPIIKEHVEEHLAEHLTGL